MTKTVKGRSQLNYAADMEASLDLLPAPAPAPAPAKQITSLQRAAAQAR